MTTGRSQAACVCDSINLVYTPELKSEQEPVLAFRNFQYIGDKNVLFAVSYRLVSLFKMNLTLLMSEKCSAVQKNANMAMKHSTSTFCL